MSFVVSCLSTSVMFPLVLEEFISPLLDTLFPANFCTLLNLGGVLWCLCAWQNRQCSCRQGQHVKSKLYNFGQNWNISTEIIHSLGLLFEGSCVFKTTDPCLWPNHYTALFFLSLWILWGQTATRQHAEVGGLDFSLMWFKKVPMCWWVWLAAAWAVSPPATPLWSACLAFSSFPW